MKRYLPWTACFGLWAIGLAVVGCADARPLARGASCPDYDDEIQPLLTDACAACHDADLAEGNYRVDSYPAVIAADDNGDRRVVAGDDQSPLLTWAAGENGHPVSDKETLAALERWVVDCRMSYLASELVHPDGWVDPTADDFHGEAIRNARWDMSACFACHGEGDDPRGGPVGVTCITCHPAGPTACDTCHGDMISPAPPPSVDGSYATDHPYVGAHRVHVLGGALLDLQYGCDACHIEPTDWRDPGHIFLPNGEADRNPRAEVIFGKLAAAFVPGRAAQRTGEPTYNPGDGTCTNVYCHGGALSEPRIPTWSGFTGTADCTLCHGTPPGSGSHAIGMAATACVDCHGAVVDANQTIVDPSLHLDADFTLGDGSKTCGACHGSDATGMPPIGLNGETSTDDPAVGAHASHVGASTFRSPLPCAACHIMPQGATFLDAVSATGHIDTLSPAEVFPGGVAFGGLGAADDAAPSYDPTTATCSEVYCHGTSRVMSADTTTTIVRTLSWTDVGNSTVVCGTCHGTPMTSGLGHLTSDTVTDCVICHSLSVDAAGAIVFEADGSSRHINGAQDFNQ